MTAWDGDTRRDRILTLIEATVDSREGARVVTSVFARWSKDTSESMTVQIPPSPSPTPNASERRPPARRTRAKRIAVLFNVDYEEARPEVDPGWVARAEVGIVATSVASALQEAGYDAELVAVDGDLVGLRNRLADLDPDCAFNLCESLAGDARLESAVPLVLELLNIPFTGSPPEVLSLDLRKDRVKQRLQAAGIPTPAGRVLLHPDDPCDLPFPLIVKPAREDGSVGISRASVVRNAHELARAVDFGSRNRCASPRSWSNSSTVANSMWRCSDILPHACFR